MCVGVRRVRHSRFDAVPKHGVLGCSGREEHFVEQEAKSVQEGVGVGYEREAVGAKSDTI